MIEGIKKQFDIKSDILGPELGMKQQMMFLNRRLSWTSEGIAYETDSKHVDFMLKEFNMERCKPVGTPMSSQELKEVASVINEDSEIHENDYMGDATASEYSSLAARMNYLALDRTDL